MKMGFTEAQNWYDNDLSPAPCGVLVGTNPYGCVVEALESAGVSGSERVILCGSRAVGRHTPSSDWDFVLLDPNLKKEIQHDTAKSWVQVIRCRPETFHKQVLGLHCAGYGIGITAVPPRREDCDLPAIVEIMTGKVSKAVERLASGDIAQQFRKARAMKICYEALRISLVQQHGDLPVTAVIAERFGVFSDAGIDGLLYRAGVDSINRKLVMGYL